MNEREANLLAAAERVVALVRRMSRGDVVVSSDAILLSLQAYDAAKRRTLTKTSFQRVADDLGLVRPKADPRESPLHQTRVTPFTEPLPEGAPSILIMFAEEEWERVLAEAKAALDVCRREHEKKGLNQNAPCPEDLALAYKRVFRAQEVVHDLTRMKTVALMGHILGNNEMPAWIIRLHELIPKQPAKKSTKRRSRSV
jgi:hypothetical protein